MDNRRIGKNHRWPATKPATHGNGAHYQVRCEECDGLIRQCRCNMENKRIIHEVCHKCIRKRMR